MVDFFLSLQNKFNNIHPDIEPLVCFIMRSETVLLSLALPSLLVARQRPNILIAIADDQSYPYASAYGTSSVSTPGFDEVARKGVAFTNAYVCSPGSSPSRASILTGRYPWQIAEAGTHASSFPSDLLCFPDFFAQHGYLTGYTGKGWGPGNWKISGRKQNPAGPVYNDYKLQPPYRGLSTIDYSANFRQFLSERKKGQPFLFWYGANEPHRPYTQDAWQKEGRQLSDVLVPPFLPDAEVVRADISNYTMEIEWFDRHLCNMIEVLKQNGLMDNTIIIVTADNGMPFPHAKANCYDAGVHVPLAICWGNRMPHASLQDAIVSLVDLFPTIADMAGLNRDTLSLSGQSLAPLLGVCKGNYTRTAAFSGRERHSSARFKNWGYPIRSIRSDNFLLIYNMHCERWPAGNPLLLDDTNLQRGYRDIDDGPTKSYLISHHFEMEVSPYYMAAVNKRPEYELFDLIKDPQCMHNVYYNTEYKQVSEKLRKQLHEMLKESGDSRYGTNPEVWESYPRLAGSTNLFPPE